ncbi:ABC-F family ATP-binding cassette domain-containing protein [Acanthopleuribacter pedis]|uniref:ABC-F family ATP-binding cassette domain-containing protein n=1 Tax=Acanthopleuribacter pedis TaxID=442870 RepID=A0A8J7U844_9BACT|nr:ABC-F family ATP-binding cassette domain-containing protein [Acanthopleuribacter pedis]MBO1322101.1 ABC-F family ATP-binding cassette domain-containing protein [Acanthopleuribacter pedis]
MHDSSQCEAQAQETAFLVADGVGFSFANGAALFADLSCSIGRRKVGLVGRNGVGKSHLLKLFTGDLAPTHGRVDRLGRIAYLPQNPRPAGDLLIADVLNVAPKITALHAIERGETDAVHFDVLDGDWDIEEQVARLLEDIGLAGLDQSRRFASLSGGEATRVRFAGLLLAKPDVLVLDEPTNNLDAASKDALYRLLQAWRGGALIVSHDRTLLNMLDRICALSTLGMKQYEGNYDHYVAQKAVEEEALRRDFKNAETALNKTKRALQKTKEKHEQRQAKGRKERRGGSQPKVVMNARRERSEGTSAALKKTADRQLSQQKEQLDAARMRVEALETMDVSMVGGAVPNGKMVLHLKDLAFTHPGAVRPLFSGINLTVTGPERVRIKGGNGSGKTTLMRLLEQAAGRDPQVSEATPWQGTLAVGVARVTYLDQHIAVLDAERSILANFRAVQPDMQESEVRWRLAKFLFRGDAAFKKVGVLSGGERLRAAMACLFAHADAPQCLLLDEPTNHLDLDAIQSLETMLRQFRGALVVITHDEPFAAAIGITRVLDLDNPDRS